MRYIEIKITTGEGGVEPIISVLDNLGITEVAVEDPKDVMEIMDKKEGYEWDYIDESVTEFTEGDPVVTVYLEENDENYLLLNKVKDAIKQLKINGEAGLYGENPDFGTLEVKSSINDDVEWKDKWKDYFKPSRISEKIVVKPSWEDYQKQPGDLVIEIDPGMAFGTGTHETTTMCVEMMEKYMKDDDNILDVGCGSGILSIGGALLGGKHILGIDIDPIAVEVSQENVKLNNVDDVVDIQYGDLTKGIDYVADMVVANLMTDILQILTPDVSKHLKKGGIYILSGILLEKEKIITDCLEANGFEVIEIERKGDWCCPVARLI